MEARYAVVMEIVLPQCGHCLYCFTCFDSFELRGWGFLVNTQHGQTDRRRRDVTRLTDDESGGAHPIY